MPFQFSLHGPSLQWVWKNEKLEQCLTVFASDPGLFSSEQWVFWSQKWKKSVLRSRPTEVVVTLDCRVAGLLFNRKPHWMSREIEVRGFSNVPLLLSEMKFEQRTKNTTEFNAALRKNNRTWHLSYRTPSSLCRYLWTHKTIVISHLNQ